MDYKTGYSLNAKMKDLILSVGRPGTKFPHCQDQGPCPLIVKAKDHVLSMPKPRSTHIPSMSRPKTMSPQGPCHLSTKPRTMSPHCQSQGLCPLNVKANVNTCPLNVKAKDHVLSMPKPRSTRSLNVKAKDHVPSLSKPRTMSSQCQSQCQHMSPQCQGQGPCPLNVKAKVNTFPQCQSQGPCHLSAKAEDLTGPTTGN